MKISLIHKGSLSKIGKIYLLLILLLAGTHFISAQCPSRKESGCPEETLSFPRGEVVYVDIDFRLRNTSQYSQIAAALDEWNRDNETNGSGVIFEYNYMPTTSTPINILHITNDAITNIFDLPDPYIVAQTTFIRHDGISNVYDATITFNTNARNGMRGSPTGSQPYYDPNAPGYDTVFAKKTRHEIGHTLGLCDVPRDQQEDGKSATKQP